MAKFSQKELKAIKSHPLKKGLKNFRANFKSRYLKSESANVTDYLAELKLEAAWTTEPPTHSKLAGTKTFMAIGALLGEPPSFMHDPESFFQLNLRIIRQCPVGQIGTTEAQRVSNLNCHSQGVTQYRMVLPYKVVVTCFDTIG